MDKIQELDERLNRLENKLRENFLLIEKKFSDMPGEIKLPDDINERFNELEDLILLLQVENTKMKEKFTGGLGFGADIDTSAINERIGKLEEQLSEVSGNESIMPPDLVEKINKIDEINNIINNLGTRLSRLEVTRPLSKASPMVIEKTLKQSLILPSKNLLYEIKNILEGG